MTPAPAQPYTPPQPAVGSQGRTSAGEQSEACLNLWNGTTETIARSLTLCGKGVMVGINRTTFETRIVPLYCDRWDCPTCGPHKRRVWMARIASGGPERFVTVTVRPSSSTTPAQAAIDLKRNWSRFVDHFRRHGHTCEYVWCLQWTQQGWPHLHILQRGSFIPQRELSIWMLKHLNSPIVDVRRIHNAKQAISYAARYMLRQDQVADSRNNNQRRIYTSAHYEDDTTDTRHYTPDPNWVWKYYRETPEEVAHILDRDHRYQHYRITPEGTLILSDPVDARNLIPDGIPAPSPALLAKPHTPAEPQRQLPWQDQPPAGTSFD